jgi:DNA invertase Pin-like site-specific DNA recombinase
MHVIGYRRVSTDEQAENGHGLDAQRTAIEERGPYTAAAVASVVEALWAEGLVDAGTAALAGRGSGRVRLAR